MRIAVAIILSFLLTSCEMIDYHPYDGRVKGDKDINRTNIAKITANCRQKDVIRFAMMGDSHRQYDETRDFVNHINKLSNVDFVIHGGDISDFGLTNEFRWVHDIMEKLTVPYIAIIGNHDVIGNGHRVYNEMYGKQNFSFIVAGIKFLCMNTNALEYDYSNPIPDFEFLETQMKDGSFDRTVAVMHSPPGSEQFNNNVKNVFQTYLKQFPGLLFCTNAHGHSTKINDLFNDGVIYYQCSCMKKRSYLMFTIYPDSYEYEEIIF